MEKLIIEKAREICKTDFMQYPDYDPDIEMSLGDAITVMVSQFVDEVDTCEIYDFITEKLEIN